MKAKEIRDMTTEEIQISLAEYSEALQQARYSHYVRPLENPIRIRMLRKDIARFHTELNIRSKQGN